MTKEEYNKLREIRCNKNRNNKHKYKTNKYGVTWCVVCGLLGNYNTKSKPLEDKDKIII